MQAKMNTTNFIFIVLVKGKINFEPSFESKDETNKLSIVVGDFDVTLPKSGRLHI